MRETLAEIEAVYRRHYPQLLRFAVASLGDSDLGRDAVHDAFVRAIRSRDTFRGEGSLESWLWRILVNVCLAERNRSSVVIDSATELTADPEPVRWPEVHAEIARLPERQRLILFLRHYADLDYEQIAAVSGVARGTVAATLHAAHARLRDVLGEVRA